MLIRFVKYSKGELGPVLIFRDIDSGIQLSGTLEYAGFDGEKYWGDMWDCFLRVGLDKNANKV